jgi:hypothetical protein
MTDLAFDPLLMSPAERTKRIRELDAAVNESRALILAGRTAEAGALLDDVHNPTATPDRVATARALRKARPQ